MRRFRLIYLALGCVFLVTSLGGTADAGVNAQRVRVKHCHRVGDVVPGGAYPTAAVRIHAVGVGCRKARGLPRRFITKVRYGRRTVTEQIGVFFCRGADYFPNRTVCTADGGKRVSWRLSSSA